jgi:hypothetical protein
MNKDYGKSIVEEIFNTKVKAMYKNDYASSRAVYSDSNFIYKVFRKETVVEQFKKFLQNYQGDLKLLDTYESDELVIFKMNKLPGETMLLRCKDKNKTSIDLPVLMSWFKQQVHEIHNTGVRCYNKYDEYKIKDDPWGNGFIFTFCDWTNGNFLYNEIDKKLYLIDLEPVNWIPRNIWNCIVRDHFRTFIKNFAVKGLEDPNYVSHLEDIIVEQLSKEIALFGHYTSD